MTPLSVWRMGSRVYVEPWNWLCRACGVTGWAPTHPETIERAHEHLTTCKEWNRQ